MNAEKEKPCILIIDDTPAQITALGRVLLPYYSVKTARSGEAGMKLLEEYTIDLILLDLFMPGLSGFDVLLLLKESDRLRNIPVVLITGGNEEDAEKGLSLGAVDVIRKPFKAEDVKRLSFRYVLNGNNRI